MNIVGKLYPFMSDVNESVKNILVWVLIANLKFSLPTKLSVNFVSFLTSTAIPPYSSPRSILCWQSAW